MTVSLSTVHLLIDDPDAALGFYCDAVGLEVRNDVSNGDFRWVTVGATDQPGVSIVLSNYLNGGSVDRDFLADLADKGALEGVHFHTDDVSASFERFAAAPGVEVLQEPTDKEWGPGKYAAVRDPAGNTVRLEQD
jgi:catechol 2,3-dioxygenase-like lactoylglutathione lyase family enzyme